MNRTKFMSLVNGFATREEADRIELAYGFAKKIHRGQFRKEFNSDGTQMRYFEHCRRAALVLITEAGVTDPKVICASLLHDCIEDGDDVHLISSIIEIVFGQDVAHLVRAVTKIPKVGYLERLAQGIALSEGRVAFVKAADRLDNLRSLPPSDPAFCARQRKETEESLLPVLLDAEKFLAPRHVTGYRTIINEIKSLLVTV